MKRLFIDEFDPKLVHVEVVPTRARWQPRSFHEYEEIAL